MNPLQTPGALQQTSVMDPTGGFSGSLLNTPFTLPGRNSTWQQPTNLPPVGGSQQPVGGAQQPVGGAQQPVGGLQQAAVGPRRTRLSESGGVDTGPVNSGMSNMTMHPSAYNSQTNPVEGALQTTSRTNSAVSPVGVHGYAQGQRSPRDWRAAASPNAFGLSLDEAIQQGYGSSLDDLSQRYALTYGPDGTPMLSGAAAVPAAGPMTPAQIAQAEIQGLIQQGKAPLSRKQSRAKNDQLVARNQRFASQGKAWRGLLTAEQDKWRNYMQSQGFAPAAITKHLDAIASAHRSNLWTRDASGNTTGEHPTSFSWTPTKEFQTSLSLAQKRRARTGT